jgi:hypothetical protein
MFLGSFPNREGICTYLKELESFFPRKIPEGFVTPIVKSIHEIARANALLVRNYFQYTTYNIPF